MENQYNTQTEEPVDELSIMEPVADTPNEEVSSEATPMDESTTGALAEEVKARLVACSEDSSCIDTLSTTFGEMAARLGIPTDRLIDEVFNLMTHKGS